MREEDRPQERSIQKDTSNREIPDRDKEGWRPREKGSETEREKKRGGGGTEPGEQDSFYLKN